MNMVILAAPGTLFYYCKTIPGGLNRYIQICDARELSLCRFSWNFFRKNVCLKEQSMGLVGRAKQFLKL